MDNRSDALTPSQDAARIGLAQRGDFALGGAVIRPSLRSISTDKREACVEPRVMQVLIALSDACGGVLSREALMDICWNGVIVGDDAINRAISELRRAAREVEAEFEVETIPRIGYRLKAPEFAAPATDNAPDPVDRRRRRLVQAGLGAAALASLAGLGGWLMRGRDDPRLIQLLERSRQALREELPDRNAQGRGFLQEAVRIAPDSAEAWGLLALAWRNIAEHAPPSQTSAAVRSCEQAARRALAIDRRNGDALSALAALQPFYGDWLDAEKRFLAVLKVAPEALPTLSHLTLLYQSTGQLRKSRDINERALSLDPLSPVFQFRAAIKNWIFGELEQADAQIDRTLQLWPRHPAVWNTRMMLFAYTGRARAGLAMLSDTSALPPDMPPPTITLWRQSLEALDGASPSRAAAARTAIREAATKSPGFAVIAMMVLTKLGDVESAFEVAEGFFLRRGPLIGSTWTGAGQLPVNDMRWRRSMFLFTPATRAMRRDQKFAVLCEAMGLTRYWLASDIMPDFRELDDRAEP